MGRAARTLPFPVRCSAVGWCGGFAVCVEHFCASGGILSLYSLIQPCGVDSPNRPCTLSDDAWGERPPLPTHQGRRSANAAHRNWATRSTRATPQPSLACVRLPFNCSFHFFPALVQREKKKAGSCNTTQKVPAVAGCVGRDGPVCSADLVLPLVRRCCREQAVGRVGTAMPVVLTRATLA